MVSEKVGAATSSRAYANPADILLDIQGLKTHFFTEDGVVKAVDGVDIYVKKGECLGVVGESGCGKSQTMMSVMRLIGPPGRTVEGSITYAGKSLLDLSEKEMTQIRGNKISMIFQQPQTCLNPVFKIGDQIAEVLEIHQGMNRKDALQRAIELLRMVLPI